MAGFVRVQPWHDTAAGWLAADPILRLGEIGVEEDTGKTKRGDGTSKWSLLGYTLGETEADSTVASLVGGTGETGTALDGRYASANPTLVVSYNPDGTIASTVENGVTTTLTYNPDGTVATQTRAGVTRTYTYSNGNLTGAV